MSRAVLPSPPGRWTLYRAGALEVAFAYGHSDALFAYLDSHRPRGHRPRAGALFCTLSRRAAADWLHWAEEWWAEPERMREPLPIWKLTYAGPEPRVYAVCRYDQAAVAYRAWQDGGGSEVAAREAARAYWTDSVELDEFWRRQAHWRAAEPFCQRPGVEVLADPDHVVRAVAIGGYNLRARGR